MPLLVAANHRRRRGASADDDRAQRAQIVLARVLIELLQHAEPDRRHAGRQRDAFADEQLEHALRVEMRTGKHLPGTEQRRRERQAPGVHVEHRDDRQDGVALADRQRVDQPLAERMQDHRTVRVQHALRPAGRARRVAHRRGVVFVERRLDVARRIGGREEILVIEEAASLRRQRRRCPAVDAITITCSMRRLRRGTSRTAAAGSRPRSARGRRASLTM